MVRRALLDLPFGRLFAGALRSSRWAARGMNTALLATSLLTLASPAPAQPVSAESAQVPEQVELDYLSDPGCLSKAQFVAEVTARIRRPVTWVVTNGAVHIELSLSQAEGGATGKLEVSRGAAEPTRREFTAESCAEVGSALALVVALALDPNARTEPLAPSPAEAPAPPSAAEPPPVTAPAAVAPPPPAPARPSRPPASPRAAAAPPAPVQYAAWLGPVVGVSSGYAPEPLVTVGLSLGARLTTGSWFSPALQLTPSWGKTGSTGPAAELGSFAWTVARLEACPVEVRLTKALGFSPCLAGELGRLLARGTAAGVESTRAERWWAAPGVTAALHLELGSWFVRLSGEAVFPAIRDEFVFRSPERSVHRPDAAAWGGRLAFGFQLGR